MPQMSKHGIKSVVELRSNMGCSNVDSPHKHRVGGTWEANESHNQNYRYKPRERPTSKLEPIKGIHSIHQFVRTFP